jgi:hypothetical protein
MKDVSMIIIITFLLPILLIFLLINELKSFKKQDHVK